MSATRPDAFSVQARWPRFSAAVVRNFRRYANWLVGITWMRFILLSVLLLILTAIVQSLPPFTWKFSETVTEIPAPRATKVPKAPKPPREPVVKIEKPLPGSPDQGVDITVDEHGVRIRPRSATAASAPASSASAASAPAASASAGEHGIEIHLPPGVVSREVIKEAIDEAKQAAREAREEAKEAAREAKQAAKDAAKEAAEAAGETTIVVDDSGAPRQRVKVIRLGDPLIELAWLWIVGSAIIKITSKGRMQAEVKAAQATEMAEAESLKRQVSEARMAAMQAQIEPHFLFNTLASIDHLIETDPARASAMQKMTAKIFIMPFCA